MSILSVDNIQPIGSGTSVTVNSAATLVLNNANSTGVVTATSFSGSGANLTGVLSNIVEDSSPQLGGMLDSNGNNIKMSDSDIIVVGTGNDLQISHSSNISRLRGATTNDIHIESAANFKVRHQDTDGSNAEDMLICTGDGAVELYHNNVKKIETAAEGVVIPSGGGNCLRVFGQNTSHATSALIIGQNSTTISQLRAYGPDTSTNGTVQLRSSRSDGSSSVDMTYNGNFVMANGYGIDFSAASGSNAGSASALLDDYEEGSWTATLNGHSSPTNVATNNPTTSRTATGHYRKIGSYVHCQVTWSNLQYNGANDMHNHQLQTITGLPFTSTGTLFTSELGWSRGIYGRYNNSIIEEAIFYFSLSASSTTVYPAASQIVQNSPGTLYHTVSNSSSSMYYSFQMSYYVS